MLGDGPPAVAVGEGVAVVVVVAVVLWTMTGLGAMMLLTLGDMRLFLASRSFFTEISCLRPPPPTAPIFTPPFVVTSPPTPLIGEEVSGGSGAFRGRFIGGGATSPAATAARDAAAMARCS